MDIRLRTFDSTLASLEVWQLRKEVELFQVFTDDEFLPMEFWQQGSGALSTFYR
jgi:hypothetical protein